jgi:hypothetical protein
LISVEPSPNLRNDGAGVFQMVLPQSQHSPTRSSQEFRYFEVPLTIPRQLLQPVRAITPRIATVLWTSVPKTTINENSQTFTSEYKIRLTGNGLVPAPPPDAVGAENGHQLKFGPLVTL